MHKIILTFETPSDSTLRDVMNLLSALQNFVQGPDLSSELRVDRDSRLDEMPLFEDNETPF